MIWIRSSLSAVAKLANCVDDLAFPHRYKEKRWDFKRIVSSGGMPSSHSSCAMGLATSVGLREGPGSPLFAMCMVFAGVVSRSALVLR